MTLPPAVSRISAALLLLGASLPLRAAQAEAQAAREVPSRPPPLRLLIAAQGRYYPSMQGLFGADLDLTLELGSLTLFSGAEVGFGVVEGSPRPYERLAPFRHDLHLGARYNLTEGELSPYLGVGFAYSYLRLMGRTPLELFSVSGSGAEPALEAGLAWRPQGDTRLLLGVRAGFPLYPLALPSQDDSRTSVSCVGDLRPCEGYVSRQSGYPLNLGFYLALQVGG